MPKRRRRGHYRKPTVQAHKQITTMETELIGHYEKTERMILTHIVLTESTTKWGDQDDKRRQRRATDDEAVLWFNETHCPSKRVMVSLEATRRNMPYLCAKVKMKPSKHFIFCHQNRKCFYALHRSVKLHRIKICSVPARSAALPASLLKPNSRPVQHDADQKATISL